MLQEGHHLKFDYSCNNREKTARKDKCAYPCCFPHEEGEVGDTDSEESWVSRGLHSDKIEKPSPVLTERTELGSEPWTESDRSSL